MSPGEWAVKVASWQSGDKMSLPRIGEVSRHARETQDMLPLVLRKIASLSLKMIARRFYSFDGNKALIQQWQAVLGNFLKEISPEPVHDMTKAKVQAMFSWLYLYENQRGMETEKVFEKSLQLKSIFKYEWASQLKLFKYLLQAELVENSHQEFKSFFDAFVNEYDCLRNDILDPMRVANLDRSLLLSRVNVLKKNGRHHIKALYNQGKINTVRFASEMATIEYLEALNELLSKVQTLAYSLKDYDFIGPNFKIRLKMFTQDKEEEKERAVEDLLYRSMYLDIQKKTVDGLQFLSETLEKYKKELKKEPDSRLEDLLLYHFSCHPDEAQRTQQKIQGRLEELTKIDM